MMRCQDCPYWTYDGDEGYCNYDPEVNSDDPCEELYEDEEWEEEDDFPDDSLFDEVDFNPYMGCYDYDIDNFGGGFLDEF